MLPWLNFSSRAYSGWSLEGCHTKNPRNTWTQLTKHTIRVGLMIATNILSGRISPCSSADLSSWPYPISGWALRSTTCITIAWRWSSTTRYPRIMVTTKPSLSTGRTGPPSSFFHSILREILSLSPEPFSMLESSPNILFMMAWLQTKFWQRCRSSFGRSS